MYTAIFAIAYQLSRSSVASTHVMRGRISTKGLEVETSALVAFAAVAATLIAVPGPDWALVLAAGLRTRAVGPAVAGLAIGYALITAAVVVGVAPLVAAVPAALVVLTVLGATYLLWVGSGILRSPRTELPPELSVELSAAPAPDTTTMDRRVSLAVRQGVGVSALNPKSLLFFLAFLPQFAHRSAPWPFGLQLAVLGAVWIVLAAGFYSVLGFTLQRTLTHHPGLAWAMTRIAGIAMILAGAGLLGEQALHIATA